MIYRLTVTWDTKLSRRPGGNNAPQIVSIMDDKGQDVTHLIDINKNYPTLQSLQTELAEKLGMDKEQLVLTEAN